MGVISLFYQYSAFVHRRSDSSSRVASVDAWLGDVACHDGPCADNNMVTDFDRHDRRIGPDRNVVTDPGPAPLAAIAPGWSTTCKRIIDEHCTVRDEAVVTDCNKLANECVGLNAASVPNYDASLNFNKWTNEGVVTKRALIQI
jgi:hypothetical protein